MAKLLSILQNVDYSVKTSQDNRREGVSSATLFNASWWGFQHSGFPRTPFREYNVVRGYKGPSNSNDDPNYWESKEIMYQSLFTFGLIEAVIERSVHESMLLRTNANGTLVMSSLGLRQILQDFAFRISQSSNDERREWHSRALSELRRAHSVLSMTVIQLRTSVFYHCRNDLVDIPSTLYMMSAIAEALLNTCRRFEVERHRGLSWSFVLNIYDELKETMIAEGWCPAFWHFPESVSVTMFASLHKPMPSHNGHQGCSASGCMANTVDEQVYVTKHTVDACSCSVLIPPVNDIICTLERREIPVWTFP